MALGLGTLTGCSAGSLTEPDPTSGDPNQDTEPSIPPSQGPFGFTHLRADGNRLLGGSGSLPTQPVTYELDLEPVWLVGLPAADGSHWIAVASDGTTAGLQLIDGNVQRFEESLADLPAGVPPVMASGEEQPRLLQPPTDVASGLSHPFPLGDGRCLLVGRTGDILLWDGELVDRVSASVLPDARFTQVSSSTYAVLAGATDRTATERWATTSRLRRSSSSTSPTAWHERPGSVSTGQWLKGYSRSRPR